MTLTAEGIALASLIALVILGVLGGILRYVIISLAALATELRAHKDDRTAHRTEQEEKLWLRVDEEFREEVRRRLKSIEDKLDHEK